MKSLLPCRLCGGAAEADWAYIDPEIEEGWQSYSVACTHDDCCTELSMDVHRVLNQEHRLLIEQALRVTWNHLNEH